MNINSSFLRCMNILLAGSTGLIGSTVLELALGDPRVQTVISLARRPSGRVHPKLNKWVSADGELLSGLRQHDVHAVICCLGTTIRNVGGDKNKFVHVDKDLVLGIAQWAKAQAVPVFCVVSSIGADASSSVFYNRVKGEMEQGLEALGFPTLHIFQPSILTGPRIEVRRGERIGIAVTSFLAPLLPLRYRPMPHHVLAGALLNAVFQQQGGRHTTASIRKLAALRS
jgi:uncharacterized protein YbjT (DUF2867 family)